MIAFNCPGCAKAFSVKDDFAGRRSKCPKCGQALIVPNITLSTVASPSEPPLVAETRAKLVLFRKRSATASMFEVAVSVDQQIVGHLNENDALTVMVDPGEHAVEVSGGSLRRSQLFSVAPAEVLEFKTYFSNWGVLGGGLILRPMNDAARGAGPQRTSIDIPGLMIQLAAFLLWVVGVIIIGFEFGDGAGFLWSFICLAAIIGFHVYRQSTMCPKCRRVWARRHVGGRLLDRTGGYHTVTRYDEHKNTRGEIIGRTERQEQVHVVNESYLNFYQCKYCGNEWTGTSQRQYEG